MEIIIALILILIIIGVVAYGFKQIRRTPEVPRVTPLSKSETHDEELDARAFRRFGK